MTTGDEAAPAAPVGEERWGGMTLDQIRELADAGSAAAAHELALLDDPDAKWSPAPPAAT